MGMLLCDGLLNIDGVSVFTARLLLLQVINIHVDVSGCRPGRCQSSSERRLHASAYNCKHGCCLVSV